MRVTQMDAFSQSKYKYPQRSNAAKVTLPVPAGAGTALSKIKGMLSSFETDDYILAGLIIVLILEGCDDYVLLAALGYLFIMGFKDARDEK